LISYVIIFFFTFSLSFRTFFLFLDVNFY